MAKLAENNWCWNRGTQQQHLIQSLPPEGLSGLDLQEWSKGGAEGSGFPGCVMTYTRNSGLGVQTAKVPLIQETATRNGHVRPCEARRSLRPYPSVSCTSSVRRKAMTP